MTFEYLCKRGNDVESIEAVSPNDAAVKFSTSRRMKKGAILQVLDKLSKIRTYKVGPNYRSLTIQGVENGI